MSNNSYLLEEKRKLEIRIIESRQELITLESDYHVKKEIFGRNKEYHQSLLSQHHDLSERKIHLEKTNRQTKQAGSQIDFLREQIKEVRNERDVLQGEYESLIS